MVACGTPQDGKDMLVLGRDGASKGCGGRTVAVARSS